MSWFDRISGRLALVLSLFALAIAMGGTSYAAVTLARNSVTSATIKNNTIRSVDVRDHSLTAMDFKPGQLPAGARGPRGAQGAPGTPGAQGVQGPAGPGAQMLTLTNLPISSYQLADGVSLEWECPGPFNGLGRLAFQNQGTGDVLKTGVSWAANGNASGQQVVDDQSTIPVAVNPLTDVTVGFTGTVRNTSTNAAVWVDVHVDVSDAGQCSGSMAYLPLTPVS